MHCSRGEVGNEICSTSDIEELENLDAPEFHARRLKAKEVKSPEGEKIILFPITDEQAKLSGTDHGVRESTPRREQVVGSEVLQEELQGNSERSPPTDETIDDAEALPFYILSPSRRTSSSVRAERRNIPNSTEIH